MRPQRREVHALELADRKAKWLLGDRPFRLDVIHAQPELTDFNGDVRMWKFHIEAEEE